MTPSPHWSPDPCRGAHRVRVTFLHPKGHSSLSLSLAMSVTRSVELTGLPWLLEVLRFHQPF